MPEARAETPSPRSSPIAIVGIGCRFPGADGPEAYWQLLEAGVDAIREVPADRFNVNEFYDPRPAVRGRMVSRWGGFLDGIDRFDAPFFGISPREAEYMDPQQRLLLEVAFEALEDAAQPLEKLVGSRTAVFVGSCYRDYGDRQVSHPWDANPYCTTGCSPSVLSGRLAFFFGFQGPCLSLDTGCSTSLVAAHLACQSLRLGEADLALAGGVNVILQPQPSIAFSQANLLSPDGRCKFCAADAAGFVRSEGVGVVVLKRLANALQDGDPVHAVILGSAVNSNGRSSRRLVTPSRSAEEAVIRAACIDAGVAPGTIDYVEAQGMGTGLGDPIEVEALAAVLAADRPPGRPLRIASVKSNIGHTEGAAGVAGLIKAALALEREGIPPSLHCAELTPDVAWDELAVVVQRELASWPRSRHPRRAGVSAMGIAGINAHVVLEEAPPPRRRLGEGRPAARAAWLLPISAQSGAALQARAEAYLDLLRGTAEEDLEDVCYTASVRRSHLGRRLAIVGRSRGELVAALEERLASGLGTSAVPPGRRPKVPRRRLFVFSGAAPLWAGVGQRLRDSEPIFREELERCDAAFADHLGRSLLAELAAPEAEGRPEQPEVAAAALFALQVALAQLWRSWGIEPDAVIGEGVGEVAAAQVAGVLTLADAAGIVSGWRPEARGRRPSAAALPDGVEPQRAAVPLFSVSAGAFVAGAGVGTVPWSLEARAPARLADALGRLTAEGYRAWVGIGPSPLAESLIRRAEEVAETEVLAVNSLRVGGQEEATLLAALGELYVGGEAVRWDRIYPAGRCHPLPAYPWQRQRYWFEGGTTFDGAGATGHPLLGRRVSLAYPAGYHVWEARLHPREMPYLSDHRVHGTVVLPETAWIEMALAAAAELQGAGPCLLSAVECREPLSFPPGEAPTVQLDLTPGVGGEARFRIYSRPVGRPGEAPASESWVLHAQGSIEPRETGEASVLDGIALGRIRKRCAERSSGHDFYRDMAPRSDEWAAAFRGIEELWRCDGEVLARVGLPPAVEADVKRYGLHPALLDTCIQALAATLTPAGVGVSRRWVLAGAGRCCAFRPAARRMWVHARAGGGSSGKGVSGEVRIFDDAGTPLAELCGLALRPQARERPAVAPVAVDADEVFYEPRWHRAPAAPQATPEGPSGSWLMFTDDGPVGRGLRSCLEARGERVVLVQPVQSGGDDRSHGADDYRIDPAAPGDCRRLVDEVHTAVGPLRGVIHLWGLAGGEERPGAEGFERTLERGGGSALHLVQALLAAARPPPLWLVTRGARPAAGGAAGSVAQASLWGLVSAAQKEHPELSCRLVDLSPLEEAGEVEALAREIWSGGGEAQVALRSGDRLVPSLERCGGAAGGGSEPEGGEGRRMASEEDDFVVEPGAGAEGRLALRAVARRPPGPGEVEVRVRAMGLTSWDIAMAVGPDPERDGRGVPALGLECAGEVAAIGPGVEGITPGEEVVVLHPGCLRAFVTAPVSRVAPKPAALTFAEAATIPAAFFAAYYGLHHLARLQSGERVLIHSAAGGLGLAAIQVARRLGAEIFVTGGSAERSGFLRSLGLEHVIESPATDLARRLLEHTGGEGVDVVLDPASGPGVAESCMLLRSCGRYVQLGPRSPGEGDALVASALGNNRALFVVDLPELIAGRPALVRELFSEILELFAEEVFQPLVHRAFPLARCNEAFRLTAQQQLLGQIVLTREEGEVEVALPRQAPRPPRPDGTYLVAGGDGELGVAVARWLVERGARHLVLAPASPASGTGRGGWSAETEDAVRELKAGASRVHLAALDPTAGDALKAILAELTADGWPVLRGVIHTAGDRARRPLAELDLAALQAALRSTVGGALSLDRLLAETHLDFFILLSAAAGALGGPPRGVSTAVAAALDTVAWNRKSRGLSALSVGWGYGGMGAASRGRRGLAAGATGVGRPAPQRALASLGRLLELAGPQVVVAPGQAQLAAAGLGVAVGEIAGTEAPGQGGGLADA